MELERRERKRGVVRAGEETRAAGPRGVGLMSRASQSRERFGPQVVCASGRLFLSFARREAELFAARLAAGPRLVAPWPRRIVHRQLESRKLEHPLRCLRGPRGVNVSA